MLGHLNLITRIGRQQNPEGWGAGGSRVITSKICKTTLFCVKPPSIIEMARCQLLRVLYKLRNGFVSITMKQCFSPQNDMSQTILPTFGTFHSTFSLILCLTLANVPHIQWFHRLIWFHRFINSAQKLRGSRDQCELLNLGALNEAECHIYSYF